MCERARDLGRLKAWLDGELAAAEAEDLPGHLAGCPDCQAVVAELERRGAVARAAFARLDPVGPEAAQVEAAWTRTRAAARVDHGTWIGRITMNDGAWRRQALWRPALAGLAVVAAVSMLFAFAPARRAAAQFLQLFRVSSFAVVPVSEERMRQLSGLEGILEADLLGKHTVLREVGERRDVADTAAASEAAGFAVREPDYVAGGLPRTAMYLQAGPAIQLDVEMARARELLAQAGITDVPLPPVDRATVGIDLPVAVVQSFGLEGGRRSLPRMELFQMRKPTVTLPEAVDPALFGESLLRLLGVPAAEAGSLARTMDWTSTFVIPVPASASQFRQVTVDGVPAVLIAGEAESGPRQRMLLWQKEGIVYGLGGAGVTDAELLTVADTLR